VLVYLNDGSYKASSLLVRQQSENVQVGKYQIEQIRCRLGVFWALLVLCSSSVKNVNGRSIAISGTCCTIIIVYYALSQKLYT